MKWLTLFTFLSAMSFASETINPVCRSEAPTTYPNQVSPPDWKAIYSCLKSIIPHTGLTVGIPLGLDGPVILTASSEEKFVVITKKNGVKNEIPLFSSNEDNLDPKKKALFDKVLGTRYKKTAPEDPSKPLTADDYQSIRNLIQKDSYDEFLGVAIVSQRRMFFLDANTAQTLSVPDVNIGNDLLYKVEWNQKKYYVNGDALNQISGGWDIHKKPIRVAIEPLFKDYPLSPGTFDNSRFQATSKKMKGYNLSDGEPIVKTKACTKSDMPSLVENLTHALETSSLDLFYKAKNNSQGDAQKLLAQKSLKILSSDTCLKAGVPQPALSEARKKLNELLN